MGKPTLAYWDIRGLAEPCRMMFEYAGVSFEEKRYVVGDAPTYDRSSWTSVKTTLGLAFPNLPYYIDEDVKLTESWAIMKHIARKNKVLLPASDVESDRCDMVEGVISDVRGAFVGMCYRPGFEENQATFFENTFPAKMQMFDKYLEKKTWLAGNSLTYVDFAFAEILDHIRLMKPSSLEKFENVGKYVDKFFALEKIAEYRTSSRFKKFPINNKMAKWGGQFK